MLFRKMVPLNLRDRITCFVKARVNAFLHFIGLVVVIIARIIAFVTRLYDTMGLAWVLIMTGVITVSNAAFFQWVRLDIIHCFATADELKEESR